MTSILLPPESVTGAMFMRQSDWGTRQKLGMAHAICLTIFCRIWNLSLPAQACMDDDMGQLQGTPLPAPNTPDLTLTGHDDTAQYALSCSTAAPLVSSGGTDHNVRL